MITQRLAVLHGTADGVTAVDVEDHVEIEVRPGRRALELGDVTRVHLVGTTRRVAPGPHRADAASCARGSCTDAVLGGIAAGTSCAQRPSSGLIQQRRPHRRRRRSPRSARIVQFGEHRLALGRGQRALGDGAPGPRGPRSGWLRASGRSSPSAARSARHAGSVPMIVSEVR